MTAIQRLYAPFHATQRVDYALLAVVFLSLNGDDFVTVEAIADHNSIGAKVLSDVLRSLRGAGIVESRPGWHGGFRLGAPATDITLDRVITALQAAPEARGRLHANDVTPGGAARSVASFWQDLDRQIQSSLTSMTIADLAAHAEKG
jgi:Rrf2 family protein